MGTNYYVALDVCPHCGRGEDSLHIGKSSAGWVFSLNTHPEHGIKSLEGWQNFLRGKMVFDEYGSRVTLAELLRVILRRSWPGREPFEPEFLERNHAEAGPNGLLRHRIDGRHCIAHGKGTWDIMRGDFS